MKYILFCIILVYSTCTLAQSIFLDSTFNKTGYNIFGATNLNNYAQDLDILSDGRIITVGHSGYGGFYFTLSAVKQNGELDTAFGNKGIVLTEVGQYTDKAYTVAIQQGNKIVVGGCTSNGRNYDFAVARYTDDGKIDTTFGNQGFAIFDLDSMDNEITKIIIQEDGKILAAGYSSNGTDQDFALIRCTREGKIDKSFGNEGFVVIDYQNKHNTLNSLSLLSSGDIIACGNTESLNHSKNEYNLLKLNSSGILDSNFGVNGISSSSELKYNISAHNIAIINNKIYVTGQILLSSRDFFLSRHGMDGEFDLTFSNSGWKNYDFIGLNDIASSIVVLNNDKIILVGNSVTGPDVDFSLIMCDLEGNVDTTFGNNGKLITNISSRYDFCSSAILNHDSKLLVFGYSKMKYYVSFALIQYQIERSSIIRYDDLEPELLIYPNPSSNYFIIKLMSPKNEILSVSIYELNGRLIKNYFFNLKNNSEIFEKRINFNKQLKSGIYIIKIQSSQFNEYRKLIIN